MAYGIPVLSTKCGGPETIINPSVGILCEKNDINSLSLALQQAFDQKGNFSTQTIQEHFQTNYSEESAWRNMKVIYDSIS
jgi:glycosyltransferase involved in cell wall biosynthesis